MKMEKLCLQRFADDLAEYGKVEQAPKLEGKRMIMLINPLPKKDKIVTKYNLVV